MSINHDLTHYGTWLVAKQESEAKEDILLLSLPNRFEVFDEDAKILEKLGVVISRIRPRDCDDLSYRIPSCRIHSEDWKDVLSKIIKSGYKISIAKEIIISKKEIS